MKIDKRFWKNISTGLLVIAMMGVAVPSSAASPGTQTAGGPQPPDPYLCKVYSPNAGMVNVLNAVAAPLVTASTDRTAWAVGYMSHPNSLRPQANTLAMRYDGKAWRIVSSPNVSEENYLNSVAARGWNDVWAAGYYVQNGLERPLVMRFTGTYWKIVQLPIDPFSPAVGSTRLNGVATIGDKGVVAVGYYSYGSGAPQPLALYFDGKSWTKMDVPSFGESVKFYGVAAEGSNMWAVGTSGDEAKGGYALLYHYDGKAWTAIAKGAGYLTSVAVSDAGVFAVGDVTGKGGKETLAMLYNPTSGFFNRVTSFNFDIDHNFLTSVASNGKEVYAVGYTGVQGNDSEMVPLVLHYDGKGFTPLAAPHPSKVNKLAGVTISNNTLWAVGSSMNGAFGRSTLILTNNCAANR